MKTRVISGAVLVVILAATLLPGGPILCAFLYACSLVGMYEIYKALGVIPADKQINLLSGAGFVGAAFFYLILFFKGEALYGAAAAAAVTLIIAVYVASFPKIKSTEAISACFGFIYVGFMLSFVYLMRMGENGIIRVWMVFVSSWVADTAAYFTGVLIGKHHMTPVLSPKKTWEGAVGGVLGAALAGALLALIFEGKAYILPWCATAAVGAVISIFGDLAASAIKRERGIKDYGNLIPGHGGIMDRFDSVIFAAPFIYLMMRLVFRT